MNRILTQSRAPFQPDFPGRHSGEMNRGRLWSNVGNWWLYTWRNEALCGGQLVSIAATRRPIVCIYGVTQAMHEKARLGWGS
jgi:hypothetical protein